MVHPVAACESAEGSFAHLRALWHELSDPKASAETKLQSVLAGETDELDLPYGFLSRIDVEADREAFDVVQGEGAPVHVGDAIPLSGSYCRKTIESPGGTLAISNAPEEGWGDDPAYRNLGASYLGATVEVDDELYGTLSFASRDARAEPIAEPEVDLVDMLAEWVGHELERGDASPERPSDERAVEPLPLWSDEVDTVMEALARQPRRVVLSALRDDAVETIADVLDHEALDSRDTIALEHRHLPHLAEAGYIEWDRESGAIARGPAFDTVDTLLGCLEEYVDEVR